jgi:hypothetical protein
VAQTTARIPLPPFTAAIFRNTINVGMPSVRKSATASTVIYDRKAWEPRDPNNSKKICNSTNICKSMIKSNFNTSNSGDTSNSLTEEGNSKEEASNSREDSNSLFLTRNKQKVMRRGENVKCKKA